MNLTKSFAGMLLLTCLATGAEGQSVPSLINYQGRLTDAAGAPLQDGAYRVAFKIWDDQTAGTTNHLMWGVEYGVTLIQGTFNTILGADGGTPVSGATTNDVSATFLAGNRFLGLTLTHTPAGDIALNQQREIVPRQQLLSAPYALQALHSQQADQAQLSATLAKPFSDTLSPPGSVIAYMGSVSPPPIGWLVCAGQEVLQSDYPALFQAIRHVGGTPTDANTKFVIPDLRGMFLRGNTGSRNDQWQDPDVGSRVVYGPDKANLVGSYQTNDFKSHTHSQIGGPTTQNLSNGSDIAIPHNTTSPTGPTGGNETRPNNVYVNYLIKY